MLKCVDVQSGRFSFEKRSTFTWVRNVNIQVNSCSTWNIVGLWSNNLFATSSQDSTIKFWDTRENKAIGTIKAEEQLTHLCHYTGRENLLVGGNSDGT